MTKKGIRNLAADFFWYSFLLLLVSATFITAQYDSVAWKWFSVVFYGYAALYWFLVVAFNLKFNYDGIRSARYILIALLLSIIWLFLQILLPRDLVLGLDSNMLTQPDWFSPKTVVSIVPDKTKALLLSEVFIFMSFIMTIALLDSRIRLFQILLIMILILLVHSVLGISAYYAGVFFVSPEQLDGHFNVARGWFVNRNHFAGFMMILSAASIFVVTKKYLYSEKYRLANPPPAPMFLKQAFNFLVSFEGVASVVWCVGLLAVALSESRAGLFGYILSSITVFLCLQLKARLARLRIAVIAMFSIALILLIVLLVSDRVLVEGLSLGERLEQWSLTSDLISQSPIVGFGGGSYATAFQAIRSEDSLRQVIYSQAHNQFLHIWVEQGLLGLLLWIFVLSSIFTKALMTLKRSNSVLAISATLTFGVVLLFSILQSLVDFNLQIPLIRLYFFISVALVFVMPALANTKKQNY